MTGNISSLKSNKSNKDFEDIKRVDENETEFWTARELMFVLGYARWENFEEVVRKAAQACINSGQNVDNHFRKITKMVSLGGSAVRQLVDWKLDRYACYLIAQNGDPTKPQIAFAQTYFAVQTRRQEIFDKLADNEKRLFIRSEVSEQNKKLFGTAKNAGVNNFGYFNDSGYRGLYGKSLAEIEKAKGIKKGELLDRAGSTELAANLFRITQTDEKLGKDNIKGERQASYVHNMVGGKVRQTIKDIGGVLPENLPPERHIKELIKELKQFGATEHPGIANGNQDKDGEQEVFVICVRNGTTTRSLVELNELLKNCPGFTKVLIEFRDVSSVKTLEFPRLVNVDEKLKIKVEKILNFPE